ncbi:MAG: 1-acyl-sn-glycerol-3-phosphate acyltransferase [Sporichthyaceae bacterium]
MTAARHVARRVLGTPGIVLLALVTLVVLPIVAVLQIFTLLGYLTGRKPRFRSLRVAAFAVLYTLGECVCLAACAGLWLASPIPGRRDADRWQRRHVRLLRRLLGYLMGAAEVLFRFRLRLEAPRGQTLDHDRPLIVLGRHAGPGASFVLVHVLIETYGRIPRIVLKERLRLDPALDVLLTRIGCAFLGRGDSTGAVATLAADLDTRDALLIYPEGSDWTPTRHELAVTRLRLRGLRARARAAAARPNVLPPRPGGTFAALAAAPAAQLAVFMHTGHDELLAAGALWQALPLRRELHMVWWSEPRPSVADEAECGQWLDDLWGEIDAWVHEQNSAEVAT